MICARRAHHQFGRISTRTTHCLISTTFSTFCIRWHRGRQHCCYRWKRQYFRQQRHVLSAITKVLPTCRAFGSLYKLEAEEEEEEEEEERRKRKKMGLKYRSAAADNRRGKNSATAKVRPAALMEHAMKGWALRCGSRGRRETEQENHPEQTAEEVVATTTTAVAAATTTPLEPIFSRPPPLQQPRQA